MLTIIVRWSYRVVFVIHIFNRCRAVLRVAYLFGLSFDVDLFCEGGGCTIDTWIVHTAEHKHLIVRFTTYAACLTYFVHPQLY